MAAATKIYFLYDGTGTPEGWKVDNTYDGKYIRGVGSLDSITTGGANTHTHSTSGFTCDTGTTSLQRAATTPNTAVATHNHKHSQGTYAFSSTPSSLPVYRAVNIIYKSADSLNVTVVPRFVIAWFNATVPGDWSAYGTQDVYIRGTIGAPANGGGSTHTHAMTGSLANNPAATTTKAGFASIPTNTHVHSAAGTSTTGIWLPNFFSVVFYQADADINLSSCDGIVAGFDGTPPTNWTCVSESGQNPYQRLLYSDASATTGGAAHGHSITNVACNADSATTPNLFGTVGFATESKSDHTHKITLTASNVLATTFPAYKDMIFAYYTPPAAPPQDCNSPGDIAINSDNIGNELNTAATNIGNELRLMTTCS